MSSFRQVTVVFVCGLFKKIIKNFSNIQEIEGPPLTRLKSIVVFLKSCLTLKTLHFKDKSIKCLQSIVYR